MRGFKCALVLVIGLVLPTLLVACGVTETGGTPAGTSSGKVTLVLDKTSYAPSSAARVIIENGLSSKIVVTDHHSSCTYVQLEQKVAGQWHPVGQCKLKTPTRLVVLAAGSVTPQSIVIPSDPTAAGSYRVALTYNNTTIYSSTFAVE